MSKLDIEKYATKFGVWSDVAIAKDAGVSRELVRQARISKGIDRISGGPIANKLKALGKEYVMSKTNQELATELGCHPMSIPRPLKFLGWSKRNLGEVSNRHIIFNNLQALGRESVLAISDKELAVKFKCNVQMIQQLRATLGWRRR